MNIPKLLTFFFPHLFILGGNNPLLQWSEQRAWWECLCCSPHKAHCSGKEPPYSQHRMVARAAVGWPGGSMGTRIKWRTFQLLLRGRGGGGEQKVYNNPYSGGSWMCMVMLAHLCKTRNSSFFFLLWLPLGLHSASPSGCYAPPPGWPGELTAPVHPSGLGIHLLVFPGSSVVFCTGLPCLVSEQFLLQP